MKKNPFKLSLPKNSLPGGANPHPSFPKIILSRRISAYSLILGLIIVLIPFKGDTHLFIGGLLFLFGLSCYLLNFALLCSFWKREDKLTLVKTIGWVLFVFAIAFIPEGPKANITTSLKEMAIPPSLGNLEWVVLLLLWRTAQVMINAGIWLWPVMEGSPFRFIFPQYSDLINERTAKFRKFAIPVILFLVILGFILFALDFKFNIAPVLFFL